MFFDPDIKTSPIDCGDKPYDLYSDWHKDAFGCRPGTAQALRYLHMTPIERRVEHETVSAWFCEGDRIEVMRTEVARFDFSRRMEYLMRREGVSEREAFIEACRSGTSFPDYDDPSHEDFRDFEGVCFNWSLPYGDAKLLEAKWEELKEG